MRIATVVIFLLFLHSSFAQSGCTDPQALNFDENATDNDGSCLYPPTDYSLTEVTLLPESIKECSGLEFLNNTLWTHNDAGNEDKIYRIDSLNGEILQTVIVATADNLDWEDFAESPSHLFIGDFGNNSGNRTDLAIHRILKSDLNSVVVNAEKIEFSYSDQTDFSENPNNHDFDCEAMLFYHDSLHLFTKNWVDNQTRHYVIPNEPGEQIAQLRETFNVGGLITSADINEQNQIVLLGYTELGFNFMWLLFDFDGSDFFSGNKRKVSLGHSSQNSQTEGITFQEDGNGYICSEEFKVTNDIILPQKLLAFSINQWVSPVTSITPNPLSDLVQVAPNPFDQYLKIENLEKKTITWQLYNTLGQPVDSGSSSNRSIKISNQQISSGIYFLVIDIGGKIQTYQLIRD